MRTRLLLALLIVWPWMAEAWQHPIALLPGPEAKGSYVVNKIKIDALDAFDPRIPAYRSWPFRFLNAIHVRTSDSFIRRELLFREGQQVDADLIAESERNLRNYNFLGDVYIQQSIVSADKVDLTVHTEDQWTLEVNLSAGASSGYSTYNFAIDESNFLGLGKTVGLAYKSDVERDTYGFLYHDPQFLNSRWTFDTNYKLNSDGWQFTNDAIRPFYSLDTKWAYGALYDSGTYAERLYGKGQTVAEIDTNYRNAVFFVSRAWGQRYNKQRFGLIFNADSLLYPHPARIIWPDIASVKSIKKNLHPINRESYQYGTIYEWDRQNFVEERYLDNFGKVEDYPVGLRLHVLVAKSENTTPLTPDYYELRSIAEYQKEVSSWQFFSLMADMNGRRQTNGAINNVIFNGYAHYYLQLPNFGLTRLRFPRQTVAASLSTTLTRDVDAPFQLSLGENEGLRGYTFKSFVGQNRLLFNLEDRIFTPFNYRLFGIGVVAFLDAGYVWVDEDNLRVGDFGISTGIGLRIGLKKSQTARVIRVDLAFPLQKDTSGFTSAAPKGYSISVSSGQIFTVIEKLPKLFELF